VIVLDTTVLVYATGADHPYREPCRRLVDAVSRRAVPATTTVEVIQEYVHVRARRSGRGDAIALGRAYADLLSPLMTVTAADLSDGLDLLSATTRLGAFDAILAATAVNRSATGVVSADRAFVGVPGLSHVVPDAAGVAALLAG
jgi:uncharacterized protein